MKITDNGRHRPLSPHLQVYKPQLTSVLSILHRATGIVIAIGAVVIALWLLGVALGKEAYECFRQGLGSPVGKGLLVIWTACTSYHLCNGIRHLFWDFGYGFELSRVYLSGKLMVVAAVLLTAGVWLI